jgi:hypothetical protein
MRFTKKIPRGGEKFQAGEALREGHAGRQVGANSMAMSLVSQTPLR